MKILTLLMMTAVAVPTTTTNALFSNVVDDSPAGGLSGRTTTPQGDPNRYIVRYRTNNRGLRQAFVGGQVHVDLPDFNAVAVTIPPEALEGLRNNPDIESIERDVLRFPARPSSIRGTYSKSQTNHESTTSTTRNLTGSQQIPYGVRLVQADQVPMGPFVPKICIIDSGYYLGHEDLPVEPQVTGDSDIGGTGEWFLDGVSHGTHVAGTIAAVDNDRGIVGVCPHCNLHIVKVLGSDGSSGAYSSDLAGAALKCRDAGANIISMSLGGNETESFEHRVFNNLLKVDNILLVAAAGNDGNTQFTYPASYDCVMSVGALDEQKNVADFSQKNSQVDISAPGVGVMSTVLPGTGSAASVTAGGSTYEAITMRGSVPNVLQAGLFNCAQGLAVCTGATGLICLIQRGGEATFATKVTNCVNGGGIGAIVYNNEAGIFHGDLGDDWSISTTAVGVSDTTGPALLALAPGTLVTLSVTSLDYDAFEGTSMATPHVSGVAGLIWSHFDATMSAQVIRDALTSTALDLGPVGRDDEYGFGLVRACNAAQALGVTGLSCFDNTSTCVDDTECDDGLFCNGIELCISGTCRPGTGNPCGSDTCDEETNSCIADQCSALGASCQFPTDCCSGRCTVIHNSLYCS